MPNLNDRVVLLPIATAQELYAAPGRVTSMVLQVSEPKKLNATKKELNKTINLETYELMDWKNYYRSWFKPFRQTVLEVLSS